MTTDKKTSVFVEEQFPLFARLSGQKIISFIKHYYESQEQANNYIEAVYSLLDYQDIDESPEDYFEYIAREIIPSIPERLISDRDLLAKHIKEVYRVRGSPEGYRIFFRALFNEEIELYNPGEDILRASDGRWVEEVAIKISSTITGNIFDLPGNRIIGQVSGSSGIVDRIETNLFLGTIQYTIYILNLVGNFSLGELVTTSDESISFKISDANIGPLLDATLTADGGHGHVIGDRVTITGSSGGSGAQATVIRTRSDSAVDFYVANGGAGYSVNNVLNLTDVFGSGQDASFVVTEVGGPFVLRDFYDDFIEYIATVTIGDSNTIYTTFVEGSANSKIWPANDFISKSNHNYDDGDKVFFYFFTGNTSYTGINDSETTVNPYYVYNSNSSAFQVVNTPGGTVAVDILTNADVQVSRASANLALANLNSTIVSSLGTSTVNTGTILSVSTTDNGYGYYSGTAVGTVSFDQISEQQLTDPVNGGILGENADIQSNYLTGTISQIDIDIQGDNYLNNENITLVNISRLGTEDAIAKAISSAIVRFPGRYIDTKGWLSWDKFLQDNYYYQEFSYEIRSKQNFVSYESTMQQTMHPAGTKMFGAIYLQDNLDLVLYEDEEIDQYIVVASNTSSPTLTFVQNSNTQNDRIEILGNWFNNAQANDFIYISNTSLPVSDNKGYRVSSVLNSNTILIYDTQVSVKQTPTPETTTGYEFTTANVINITSGFGLANVGDDIFITDAKNETNNGGPFIILSKVGNEIQVKGYDGDTTPFNPSINDKTAKIEIRRSFTFSSSTSYSANVVIYRYANTYPYSNNTVL